jgi:hypothetical protein
MARNRRFGSGVSPSLVGYGNPGGNRGGGGGGNRGGGGGGGGGGGSGGFLGNLFKPKTATATSTFTPSDEQQKVLDWVMPFIHRVKREGAPELGKAPFTEPFTAAQTAGQGMALTSGKEQTQLGREAAGLSTDIMGGKYLDPRTNPALQGTIDAAVRPITQELHEQTVPKYRDEAVLGGSFGGSRQGIAEGLASGRASQAIGDTAAKISTEGYLAGLDQLTKTLGLAPSTTANLNTGAITTSGVGEVQQAQLQRQRDEQKGRELYGQQKPLIGAQELLSLLGGIPGGTSTTTGPAPTTNPLTGALGGLTLGSAVGSAIPGLGTAIGGAGGAGIGAILSILGMA